MAAGPPTAQNVKGPGATAARSRRQACQGSCFVMCPCGHARSIGGAVPAVMTAGGADTPAGPAASPPPQPPRLRAAVAALRARNPVVAARPCLRGPVAC
jgi:hypothetical protein